MQVGLPTSNWPNFIKKSADEPPGFSCGPGFEYQSEGGQVRRVLTREKIPLKIIIEGFKNGGWKV